MKKTQHDFLALRHLAVCTKIFLNFVFCILEVFTKAGYFNTGFVFLRRKIQTNIKQTLVEKYTEKITNFQKHF
jgi:hypothetical protein